MTELRIAPSELRRLVQARFGDKLRRAGSFAQLTVLGAAACLDAAVGTGPLGMIWTSTYGALAETRAALAELRSGEPMMPYTFIATQPHLAAPLFAQHVHPLARSAFLHLEPGGERWLLELARAWRRDCERILVGWVEESVTESGLHRSDWSLLAEAPGDRREVMESQFLRALQRLAPPVRRAKF